MTRSPTSSTRSVEIENEEHRRQLCKIEKITLELINKVKSLKLENQKLKNYLQAKGPEEQDALELGKKIALQAKKSEELGATEFHTDEEELGEETVVLKTGVLNQNQQNIPEQENQPSKIKVKAPPPNNIIGVTEYGTIQSLTKSVTTKEYRVVALNNNIWKINTTDSETYRALAAKLTDEGKE